MEEYRVMSTSQGTCVRIEQTSEVIRVTYEMCTAVKPAAVQKNTVKPAAIEIKVRVY